MMNDMDMDYEYKLLHSKDMHNRCCGGQVWCVQVSFDLLFHSIFLCNLLELFDDHDIHTWHFL